MNMITIEGKLYIKSQNIRVFPCAYRGYYNSEATPLATLVFDPEARATTEANFANTYHSLSYNKNSYVVAWVPDAGEDSAKTGTLKCVIGGYYFEIYNHTMEDFFYEDTLGNKQPYYLCIQTTSIGLGTSEPDESDVRTTEVLSSFANATNYLDLKQNNNYAFTGLLVSKTADGMASLAPFITATKYVEAGKAGMVPQTDKYYFTAENGFMLATGVTLEPGTQLYMKKNGYKIDPTKFPITNLLDVGTGEYSIRMIEDDTEQGTNTTTASGNYSVSLGKNTKATAEASTALGDTTTASGKGALSFGENSEALGRGALAGGIVAKAEEPGSVALGDHVSATAANQVVLGKYSKPDSRQALILANGTSETDQTANKFTVSYDGDVTAQGKLHIGDATELKGSLEVNGSITTKSTLTAEGSITANGASANNLTLGSRTSGSYGTIAVYGEGTSKVLTVNKNGNLEIAGKGKSSPTVATDAITTLTTKGYVESFVAETITTSIAGKADADTVATNLTNAINEAKTELIAANNAVIAEAVATAKTELLKSVSDDFAARDTTDTPPTAAESGTGKYVVSVSQTNGQIAPTEGSFVSSISSTNTNDAPTAAAVATFVDETVSKIWLEEKVKKTANGTGLSSLQAIILDAVYPVGSIYMQYVASTDSVPSNCPLAATLTGSSWELIKNGLFLRSVGDAYDDRGDTGGSADAIIPSHSHNVTSTTVTISDSGAHSHSVTKQGTAHDGGSNDTFRLAQNSKGGKQDITWNISSSGSHTHSFTISGLTTDDPGESVTNKNLPPYLNVYMWRRTK